MHRLQLLPAEARVLGVLIEKERTTPEGYPLSLNALVAGCNQKSNRDPVTSLGEREVSDAILRLRVAGLVEFVQLSGQRVEKYRHKAGDALHAAPDELAVLAELLLRGPQQPGALRSRAARMHPLPTLEALQAALDRLAAKQLAARDERRDGERTARWAQRLVGAGNGTGSDTPAEPIAEPGPSAGADRVGSHAERRTEPERPPATVGPPADADLEARVARLEAEVAALRARLDGP